MGPPDCRDQPCGAVARGLHAFLDRSRRVWTRTVVPAPTATCSTDNFQLSPADAEARFQLLQQRRQRHPDADDPLFRPIDADDFRTNGENASDFSNLRENGLVRITFPLPANMSSSIRSRAIVRSKRSWTCGASVPTVNDVKLTGPDGINPWSRGPNNTGGYQLDGRIDDAAGSGARRARQSRADPVAPPQRMLDDLAAFQSALFTNPPRSHALGRHRRRPTPFPDADPPLTELEQQGKTGVPTRLRPVPRRAVSRTRKRRSSGSTTSRTPVSASRPTPCHACAIRLRGRARRASSATRGPTRSRWPTGRTMRRTSSDPGPGAVDGFRRHGVPAAQDDWKNFDVPGASRDQQDRSVLPQQQRGDPGRGRGPLHRVLQARAGERRLAPDSADSHHRRRARRSTAPRPEERAALLAYLRKL